MLRASILLAILLTSAGLGVTQNQDPAKVQMKISKVSGNVYMLEAPPDEGNVGVCVGNDGIVLVDDQEPPFTEKIPAMLKGITDKPVRFIVDSHYHLDHIGGNEYFQKQALVIAPDNLRKRMKDGSMDGDGATEHYLGPQPTPALPTITFDHELTVHLNGEVIHVVHFPAAHTDGDAVVFFPKSNVVHMGDIFVTYGFPYIDLDAGGSIDGMIDAIVSVIAQVPADAKIIPGHGPISSIDDLHAYVTRLKEMRAVVQKALNEGKTLDQMQEAKLLDPWKKYAGPIGEERFLKTLYKSIAERSAKKI